MAEPHEPLECLKFGRMIKKLKPESVAIFKPYATRILKMKGVNEEKSQTETDLISPNYADLLLELKSN